jgi:hypothetical protein
VAVPAMDVVADATGVELVEAVVTVTVLVA